MPCNDNVHAWHVKNQKENLLYTRVARVGEAGKNKVWGGTSQNQKTGTVKGMFGSLIGKVINILGKVLKGFQNRCFIHCMIKLSLSLPEETFYHFLNGSKCVNLTNGQINVVFTNDSRMLIDLITHP